MCKAPQNMNVLQLPHRPEVAVGLECLVCFVFAGIVAGIAFSIPGMTFADVKVPLFVIASGFAGCLMTLLGVNFERSRLVVGAFKTRWWLTYAVRYYLGIQMMMLGDVAVHIYFGLPCACVVIMWLSLVSSASTTSLFLTDIPFLSFVPVASRDSKMKYGCTFIGLLLGAGQLVLTLLDLSLTSQWHVILIQLAVRRVLTLGFVHVVAWCNYGLLASYVLVKKQALEFVILACTINDEGSFVQEDAKARAIMGNLLIKLPILGGESMGAFKVSRVVDKLIFAEQMWSFSSPTMVSLPELLNGHIAFFRLLTDLQNLPGWMYDKKLCEEYVVNFAHGIPPDNFASPDDWHKLEGGP